MDGVVVCDHTLWPATACSASTWLGRRSGLCLACSAWRKAGGREAKNVEGGRATLVDSLTMLAPKHPSRTLPGGTTKFLLRSPARFHVQTVRSTQELVLEPGAELQLDPPHGLPADFILVLVGVPRCGAPLAFKLKGMLEVGHDSVWLPVGTYHVLDGRMHGVAYLDRKCSRGVVSTLTEAVGALEPIRSALSFGHVASTRADFALITLPVSFADNGRSV